MGQRYSVGAPLSLVRNRCVCFESQPSAQNLFRTSLATLSGVCQANADATKIVLPSSASAVDSAYNGCRIQKWITADNTLEEIGTVSSYVGATRTATMTGSWSATPTTTSTCAVYPNPLRVVPFFSRFYIDRECLVNGIWVPMSGKLTGTNNQLSINAGLFNSNLSSTDLEATGMVTSQAWGTKTITAAEQSSWSTQHTRLIQFAQPAYVPNCSHVWIVGIADITLMFQSIIGGGLKNAYIQFPDASIEGNTTARNDLVGDTAMAYFSTTPAALPTLVGAYPTGYVQAAANVSPFANVNWGLSCRAIRR